MVELKKVIFDKSFIQGTKNEKLKQYKPLLYEPLITTQLVIECLGDLTNNDRTFEKELKKKGITKEEHVATLMRKIFDFPLFLYLILIT